MTRMSTRHPPGKTPGNRAGTTRVRAAAERSTRNAVLIITVIETVAAGTVSMPILFIEQTNITIRELSLWSFQWTA